MNLRSPLVAAFVLTPGPIVYAQAPLLQDGASSLRQARLDWTAGNPPLAPSSLPSFEAGWGGAESQGSYAPLADGEGLGHGTQGWGLGFQGRYTSGGWRMSATVLALRDRGRTTGILQRASLAYQTESGWRTALEQTPLAWGTGLNGGDLLGDAARPFPRLSLATPEVRLPLGRWRMEAFAGRLEADPPIPDWIPDRDSRTAAQAAGFGLRRPGLWGGLLRAAFAEHLELNAGAVSMEGGQTAQGQAASNAAKRIRTLVEARLRLPALARLAQARGASVHASRSAQTEGGALSLASGRTLAGLQLVWEGWDLGAEYAGATPRGMSGPFLQPAYLAGFSTHGDPLGSAFGPQILTRTLELGLPLFLEGQGRLKAVRATAALDHPSGASSWFLQAEGQWRTPTGRIGASVASRRNAYPGPAIRWGWTFSIFQAFRVF